MNIRVALIGGKGTGKTTFAQAMVDWYGFTKLSFADPIKYSLLRAVNTFLEDQGVPPTITLSDLVAHKDTFRLGMQWLGTDIVRDLCARPSHWIDNLHRRVDAIEHYAQEHGRISALVIDDVRFENEAAWLRERGFQLVRLRRHGVGDQQDAHKSEQEYRLIQPHLTLSLPHGSATDTVAIAKDFTHDLLISYFTDAAHVDGSPLAAEWLDRFDHYDQKSLEQKLREIGGVTSLQAAWRETGAGVGSVQNEQQEFEG